MMEDKGHGKTKSMCLNNTQHTTTHNTQQQKTTKNKKLKPKIICQVKLSFRNEVKIKAFPNT